MCRSFYRLGRLDRTSRSLTFSTFSSLGSSSASLHHVGGGEYQTFARNRLFSMPRRKIGLFPIKSMADNDQVDQSIMPNSDALSVLCFNVMISTLAQYLLVSPYRWK